MSPTMNSPTLNKAFAWLFALGLTLQAASGLWVDPAVAAPPPKTSPAAKAPAAKGKTAPEAPSTGTAGGIDTEARAAYVVDYRTGVVLLDKNSEERIPPASMSKMMTYYTVFSYLKEGKATLDDMLPVSQKAWRTQGSKMFVPLGGRVKIEDLLRGVIIQSGNDACIVLPEGLARSEQAFVDEMNKKAQEIGLTGSHFTNVTGLPDPQHYLTARGRTTLARHIITDHREFYKIDAERDFTS